MLRNAASILVVLFCLHALAADEHPSTRLVLPTPTATTGWPSLHNGGNTSTELKRLPLHWSEEKGVAWQAQLPGYGQSAPVIWGERVYVTAIEGDDKEIGYVLAFDLISGDLAWKHEFSATTGMENSYMVSRAAPTSVVDGEGVYALFEGGDLRALTHDGELRWAISLFDDEERRFDNAHGYGASPTQTADAVVVVVDHRGPSYLAAISKATGQELWKSEREPRSSWTSPQVARLGDREQIIISSGGTVDGYDADTGEQLWSHTGLSGNQIPSLTVQGDRVFIGADLGNQEKDADSVQASNRCLRVMPDSDNGYELLWKAKRVLSHYVSPLAHRGHVYFLNKVGVLYCLDAETGDELYAQRTSGPCWAQPIAAGNHVYLFHKDGQATVLSAGAEFDIVSKNRIWPQEQPPLPSRSFDFTPPTPEDRRPEKPRQHYMDPLVYGVAAVDGAFVVRLGTHLYCLGQPENSKSTLTTGK